MKLSPALILVQDVFCSVPKANFAEEDIEKAADLILQADGVINPLIVKRTGVETYELIDGYFEYYAAVRAMEKDAFKGELVGAFIVDQNNAEAIKTQIDLFRSHAATSFKKPPVEPSIPASSGAQETIAPPIDVNLLLQQFEALIDKKLHAVLRTIHEDVDQPISSLKNFLHDKFEQVNQKLQTLETAIGSAPSPKPSKTTPSPKSSKTTSSPNPSRSYEQMNVTELKAAAKQKGLTGYSKFRQETKQQLIDLLKQMDGH